MTISAVVVEDSLPPKGCGDQRITTLLLRYPRFIHSEFMTHRVFSRNASSSRAIPFKKQLYSIRKEPATFVYWGRNQRGMQAAEELSGWRLWLAKSSWNLGLLVLQPVVWLMSLSGVHKQNINRMLEPWSHINVVVTATDWDNFFELRDHKDAQPEFRVLAQCIRDAMRMSAPKRQAWHLPFVTRQEREDLDEITCCNLSTARCARTSYMTHEGIKPRVNEDCKLALRLKDSKHMSPFEHAATFAPMDKHYFNLQGWQSYRYLIEADGMK